MCGVVCNTVIMVLLNSHFYTNQYKLYSYSYCSYHMFYYKSNIDSEPIT